MIENDMKITAIGEALDKTGLYMLVLDDGVIFTFPKSWIKDWLEPHPHVLY